MDSRPQGQNESSKRRVKETPHARGLFNNSSLSAHAECPIKFATAIHPKPHLHPRVRLIIKLFRSDKMPPMKRLILFLSIVWNASSATYVPEIMRASVTNAGPFIG